MWRAFEGETNLSFLVRNPLRIPTSKSETDKKTPFPFRNEKVDTVVVDPSNIYTSCFENYYKRKFIKRQK